MTIVGPRPSLPDEVKEFEGWMLKRLNVKPGLTCYWQVLGRNDIEFNEWMKLDIKYVKERNILIDIKLILKTFFVLIGDKNASQNQNKILRNIQFNRAFNIEDVFNVIKIA